MLLRFRKVFQFLSVFVLFLSFPLFLSSAAEKHVRIRDPKVKCGIYFSSSVDSTTGVKVAGLSEEGIRRVKEELPKTEARLVYLNRQTGKPFKSAEALKKGLEDGIAKAYVDRPAVYAVGVPHFGLKRGALMKKLRSAVQDLGLENVVKVNAIGRPVRPDYGGNAVTRPVMMALEVSSLASQKFFDLFPMFIGRYNQDYQRPDRGEVEAMLTKLVFANSLQQGILFASQPLPMALFGGVANYGNSAATGGYRKVISNWFNRASNSVDDLARKFMLTAFFTVELYWFSRILDPEVVAELGMSGSLDPANWGSMVGEITDITQGQAWLHLLGAKWSAMLFSVLWRTPYYRGIHGWEARMERDGRIKDARRTAGRFELLGTLIATPAFLIASMQPQDAGFLLRIMGQPVMQLGIPHLAMGLIGGLFQAFHSTEKYHQRVEREGVYIDPSLRPRGETRRYKAYHRLSWMLSSRYRDRVNEEGVPLPAAQRTIEAQENWGGEPASQWTRMKHQVGWGLHKTFLMDPWVERFDKAHGAIKWTLTPVRYAWRCIRSCGSHAAQRARDIIDVIEGKLREPYEREYEVEHDPVEDHVINYDVRDFIEMDGELTNFVAEDPSLIHLIHKDSRVRRLIERDPEFNELREKLDQAN